MKHQCTIGFKFCCSFSAADGETECQMIGTPNKYNVWIKTHYFKQAYSYSTNLTINRILQFSITQNEKQRETLILLMTFCGNQLGYFITDANYLQFYEVDILLSQSTHSSDTKYETSQNERIHLLDALTRGQQHQRK